MCEETYSHQTGTTVASVHACLSHAPGRGVLSAQSKPWRVQFCQLLLPTQPFAGHFPRLCGVNVILLSTRIFPVFRKHERVVFGWTGERAVPHAPCLPEGAGQRKGIARCPRPRRHHVGPTTCPELSTAGRSADPLPTARPGPGRPPGKHLRGSQGRAADLAQTSTGQPCGLARAPAS